MLLIDERIDDRGAVVETRVALAEVGPARLQVRDGGELVGELSCAALETVMRRYGRPLDAAASRDGELCGALELGAGRVLRHLRFRAWVDASSRDYLVWRAPGEPDLAAISSTAAAALRHLAKHFRNADERAR